MDPGLAWEAIFGVVLFFVFLAAGLEILWSFVLAGAIIYMLVGFGIGDIPRIVYHNIDKEVLMAVAYFILAGGLTGEGGIADKLVVWVNDLIGWIRGGLAASVPCWWAGWRSMDTTARIQWVSYAPPVSWAF